jgi:hypothetical protein
MSLEATWSLWLLIPRYAEHTHVGRADFWGESDIGVYNYNVRKFLMGIHILKTWNLLR